MLVVDARCWWRVDSLHIFQGRWYTPEDKWNQYFFFFFWVKHTSHQKSWHVRYQSSIHASNEHADYLLPSREASHLTQSDALVLLEWNVSCLWMKLSLFQVNEFCKILGRTCTVCKCRKIEVCKTIDRVRLSITWMIDHSKQFNSGICWFLPH